MVAINYPDNGGVMTLGANSDAGWVYLVPQTDPITGNITYAAVPPPATGAFAFSEGIEPDEFGQAGISLAAEVGVGLAVLAVTGAPITLGGALVVEGTILLGSGIAYINEQMSQPDGTYHVRPIETPQGMVMGDGTQYVVTVSTVSTTIQVIEGSAIFVDQYTNNTVTVSAGQMLTLPSGVSTGFSQQDLQANLSSFDTSSISEWWKITPVATPTETTTVTATPVASSTTKTSAFLFSPIVLALIIPIIIVVVVVVLLVVVLSRKKSSKQPRLSNKSSNNQNLPPPPPPQPAKTTVPTTETPATVKPTATQPKLAFCPDCGKQLSNPKGFCPFCGFDLGKFTAETKQ